MLDFDKPARNGISIHAPARGATVIPKVKVPSSAISIHAPARGATGSNNSAERDENYFNPRTREGCDTVQVFDEGRLTEFQSTHPRGVRLSP